MSNNVPNLDTLEAPELREFSKKHRHGSKYLELFPQGGEGTKLAAADLARYAEYKASAVELRLKGKIEAAQHMEEICENIYARIPIWAHW